MNLDPRTRRQVADLELVESSWWVMTDPAESWRVRFKACLIYIVFNLRVAIGWHRDPLPWFRLPVHGNYCGPGHNRHPLPPVDHLDYACKAHDDAYVAARKDEPQE